MLKFIQYLLVPISFLLLIVFLNLPLKELLYGNCSYIEYLENQTLTLYFLLGEIIKISYDKFCDQLFLRKRFVVAFSFLFSLSLYIGKSYNALHSWSLLYYSLKTFCLGISLICFISISIYKIIALALTAFKFLVLHPGNVKKVNERKISVIFFLIFFGINLFYLIVLYPGTATHDGVYQLLEFYGYKSLSNHLPVLATLIEGGIFHLGLKLHSQNIGIFLYVILQTIIQSFVFSKAIIAVYSRSKNTFLVCFIVFFFILNPLFHIWGITFVKDTMYYICFLWFILNLIDIFEDKYTSFNAKAAELIISTFLLVIFRNNGIHVVLPTLLFLALFKRKNRLARNLIFINIMALVVFSFGWSKYLTKHNIPQPIEEALSIPFQQTARLMKEDVPVQESDRKELYRLFNNKNIADLYNPEFADPVKFSFKWGAENRAAWKKIYTKYLKKYPTIYLEGFLNQCYGYFYPLQKSTDLGSYSIPIDDNLKSDYIYLRTKSPSPYLSKILIQIPDYYQIIPVLNLFYNCSFYTWTTLFAFMVSLIKKDKELFLVSLPMALSLGVCILSPVNACIRYMLSIIVVTPVIISLLGLKVKDYEGKSSVL